MTTKISPAVMPRKLASAPVFAGSPGALSYQEFLHKVQFIAHEIYDSNLEQHTSGMMGYTEYALRMDGESIDGLLEVEPDYEMTERPYFNEIRIREAFVRAIYSLRDDAPPNYIHRLTLRHSSWFKQMYKEYVANGGRQ